MNTITSDFTERENKTERKVKKERRLHQTAEKRRGEEVLTFYSDGCRGNAGRLHKRTVLLFRSLRTNTSSNNEIWALGPFCLLLINGGEEQE